MSQQARVLYVEDDELERRAFLRLVRGKGLPWEITQAGTLAAARAALAESSFDVIVVDYHLPDGDSIELFGEAPHIPFVLVTGTLEEQLALRMLERGADDYLIKDLEHRHLEALPFAVEKTLYRKAIHEREQRLARELRESELRLRATFENAASGIVEVDGQGRLAAVNGRFCQMLGYAREELLGKSVQELTHPEDRPRCDELNAQLRDGRIPLFQCEERCLMRDGSPLWVQAAVSAVRDDAGRFLYSVATLVDISARKAAEAQVRLQAAALEAAPNAISLSKTDPGGTIVWVNPAFTALTGYSAAEAVGHSHHLLSSGRHDEAFYRSLWETIKRGEVWRGELVNRRKDGALYHEEMGITPLRDEHGRITHFVAIKQDITARKQAEEALRESDQRHRVAAEELQAVMDAAPAGICVAHDPQCILITGNALAHEILGVPQGANISVTPGQGPAAAHFRMYRDGIEAAGGEMPMQMAATTGVVVRDVEFEVLRGDGTRRTVLLNAAPLRGADGAVCGAVGAFTDITERKRAEEALAAAKTSAEQAKAAAEEANRAKDHFLAVLSHELRTPLTPVVTAVSMLQKQWRCDQASRETLEMIRRNVEMEARLIDDLLDVTRIVRGKVELDRQPIPLCGVIQRAVEVCRPDIEARQLHFGVDIGPCAPYMIHADAGRLQQVFWNLLKNAIKFTPHGGCVGIRCVLDAEGHVVAEVIDSGEGIDPALLPHIFSPFEQGGARVTRQFGGLGLGLTITKGLVEMHGGSITAHSDGKGKGATFRVRLPIHTRGESGLFSAALKDITAAGAADSPAARPRSLRILLVEDHGDTAKIMRRLLMAEGHQVGTAGDVATALELAGRHAFDLLLSDLGLPDGSGVDLMHELRARGSAMPGIALSGYGQEEDIRRSKEAGFVTHLTKPISPDRLAKAIAAAAGQGIEPAVPTDRA